MPTPRSLTRTRPRISYDELVHGETAQRLGWIPSAGDKVWVAIGSSMMGYHERWHAGEVRVCGLDAQIAVVLLWNGNAQQFTIERLIPRGLP